MLIYKAVNKVNGKMYVGQTIKALERRISQHICKTKSAFSLALRKYGTDSFEFSIVELCESRDQLNEREIYWIAFHNCMAPNGYNLDYGGVGSKRTDATKHKLSLAFSGRKLSEEHKAKLSIAHRGKTNSAAAKEKCRAAVLGIKRSEETRRRMSLCKIGRSTGKKGIPSGWVHSEEAKQKNKAAHLGKTASEETRRKMSEERKKRWADPEYIEKMGQMHSTRIYTEDERRRRAEGAKRNWEVRKENASANIA